MPAPGHPVYFGRMQLSHHPEYDRYLRARETDAVCRQAVAEWFSAGDDIEGGAGVQTWTPESALRFVQELSRLFTAYNRVLWEEFPYCTTCYGQCCVLDATRISAFDCIALTMLGHPFPVLPERIAVREMECIYHTRAGCAWPGEWRAVKCWLFYCALGDPTDEMAAALARVIDECLPQPLRRYEALTGDPLASHASDPVDLAEAFDRALHAVFTAPFEARYGALRAGESATGSPRGQEPPGWSPQVRADVLEFIVEAAERLADASLAEGLGVLADQFLADLGLLEGILDAGPEHTADVVRDLHRRYDGEPPDRLGVGVELRHRMRDRVAALLRDA